MPQSSSNLFEPNPKFARISGGWTKRRVGRGIHFAIGLLQLAGVVTAIWLLIRHRRSAGEMAVGFVGYYSGMKRGPFAVLRDFVSHAAFAAKALTRL